MNLPFFKLLLDFFNVPTLVNGQLVVNGSTAVPVSKTLAQFQALNTSTLADGAVIHLTDVHDRSGVGGTYITWDAVAVKWAQNFGTCCAFSTRAAALAAFPAASFPGFRIYSADYGNYKGGYEVSDGTYYNVERETAIYRNPSPSNCLTQPGVQPDAVSDNGGLARISFPSTHGITSGAAIPGGGLPNSQVYVTTTANGWTADTWITITAVSDTAGNRYFDTDAAYAGKSGPPTLAIITGGVGTLVTMRSVTIPPLSANGGIIIEALTAATVSANNKNLTIKLNGSTLFNPTWSSATSVAQYTNSRFVINNVNSRSSQKTASGATNPIGTNGASGTAPGTSTVDTGVNTTLTINWQPTTVNERMYFDSMAISVRP